MRLQAKMPRWCWCCLALSLTLALGCGRDDDAPAATPDVVSATPGAAVPAAAHPTSEEDLVESVANAIAGKDLAGLKALAAPELAATLHQRHAENPAAFWSMGQTWVENVRSGFVVRIKSQTDKNTWRALLVFDNGRKETVKFTKYKGGLVFEEL